MALFDEALGLTYPSASGTQGGGNAVFESYEIFGYPTVIVITPDHQIVNQFIDPPTTENILDAVIAAGGMWVSAPEEESIVEDISIYPNPITASGYLSMNTTEQAVLSYSIFDITGKRLFGADGVQTYKGQKQIQLPVESLNNGMYFVKLLVNEKVHKTIRFIVAK